MTSVTEADMSEADMTDAELQTLRKQAADEVFEANDWCWRVRDYLHGKCGLIDVGVALDNALDARLNELTKELRDVGDDNEIIWIAHP